jgi:hypothetical protein
MSGESCQKASEGGSMEPRQDLSPEFFKIAKLIEKENLIDNADNPRISSKLQEHLKFIKNKLADEVNLDFLEVIILSRLFLMPKRHMILGLDNMLIGDILQSVFSSKVPVSRQLDVIRQLIDKNVIQSHIYPGKLTVNATHATGYGTLSRLFNESLGLSDYGIALIINDEEMLAHFGRRPYINNAEFLNDWADAIMMISQCNYDIDAWGGYEQVLMQVARAKCHIGRISKRMEKTTLSIPFCELKNKHSLTLNEQMFIMYSLGSQISRRTLTNNACFMPDELNCYITRPMVTKDSRLVKLGILSWIESRNGHDDGVFALNPEIREFILGEAVLLEDKPLLE